MFNHKLTKKKLERYNDTYSASVNELLWFAHTMLQNHGKPRQWMLWMNDDRPRPSRLWNEVNILYNNSAVEDLEDKLK